MSIKLVKRCTRSAASVPRLRERVAYLENASHPNHLRKSLQPPRNYNCLSQAAQDFIAEVIRIDAEYKRARRVKGIKKSRRLFEEVVYSSAHFANLTPLEREFVEARIISLICSDTACRTAWHIDDDTGRADLHIFFASKNLGFPPSMTLWCKFGGKGKPNIYASFDDADDDIARCLSRERGAPFKSAQDIRRERSVAAKGVMPTLAEEIAARLEISITRESLAKAIAKLGHSVTKVSPALVFVTFKGGKKTFRYNIKKLLAGTHKAQELALIQTNIN